KIIDKIGNKKYIKQEDIDNIMQEINPALLKADVDYEVVIRQGPALLTRWTSSRNWFLAPTPSQR
ncbi:MAG: signal recognition particle receptor subunit alpha, partial [Candidatus Phytoplasma australasiaticum]|nr:signal recognition particle receptor subunit alpha [Candidatus Phytoplasma australasiaticum]